MKFFRPEMFDYKSLCRDTPELAMVSVCEAFNYVLDREGKVVYSQQDHPCHWGIGDIMGPIKLAKHKALLINIEPIEACTHPEEKVEEHVDDFDVDYTCECGVKLKPKTFEAI